MWKGEREKEEQVKLILKSLTKDRRIHRALLSFSDKLPNFIDFIRSKGPEFIRKINVPAFPGSLLLDTRSFMNERNSEFRSIKSFKTQKS